MLGASNEHRPLLAIGVVVEMGVRKLFLTLHLTSKSCAILGVSENLNGHQ